MLYVVVINGEHPQDRKKTLTQDNKLPILFNSDLQAFKYLGDALPDNEAAQQARKYGWKTKKANKNQLTKGIKSSLPKIK